MNYAIQAKPQNTPPQGLRLQDHVVSRVLQINPGLRQGRTDEEVRQALEQGASIVTGSQRRAEEPAKSQDTDEQRSSALAQAVTFFFHNKGGVLREKLRDIEERRRELELREDKLRQDIRQQISAFVSLLDEESLRREGEAALKPHEHFLHELELTVGALLGGATHGARCRQSTLKRGASCKR